MKRSLVLAALGALLLAALPGVAVDDATASTTQQIGYSTEEQLRVALGQSPHVIGLTTASDGSETIRVFADAPDTHIERTIAEELGITVLISQYTSSELSDLKERATLSAQSLKDGEVFATHYDAERDAFQIHGSVSSGTLSHLAAGEYEYVEMAGGRDSRLVDSSPFRGGARMRPNSPTIADECTTGFAVTIGGTRRMVTAAHCGPSGAFYYNGSGTTRPLGNLTRSSNYPLYDAGYLSGYAYRGAIYTGGSLGTSKGVVHAGDAGLGGNYCVSGSFTYEICGLSVQHMNDAFCDAQGCSDALRYAFTGTKRTSAGDSGAPFYANYGSTQVGVRGIHIGRIGSAGYVTKWSVIKNLWAATIVTS